MSSAFEFVVADPSGRSAAEDRTRIRSRCLQGRNKREGSRRSLREARRGALRKTAMILVGSGPPPAPSHVALPLAEYVDSQSRETLFKGTSIPLATSTHSEIVCSLLVQDAGTCLIPAEGLRRFLCHRDEVFRMALL